MKYFILFKRQTGQTKHAYSLVTKEILANIPEEIIENKKEVEDIEIPTKEQLRSWVEDLGGIWYGNS